MTPGDRAWCDHVHPTPTIKPGNVVRLHLRGGDTVDGVVEQPSHDGYLILEGPDGIYDRDVIERVERLALLPPEE